MNKETKEKLINLCLDIYSHDRLNMEITLCGNGKNAFECCGVADEILEILGIEFESLDIDTHTKELAKYYGREYDEEVNTE